MKRVATASVPLCGICGGPDLHRRAAATPRCLRRNPIARGPHTAAARSRSATRASTRSTAPTSSSCSRPGPTTAARPAGCRRSRSSSTACSTAITPSHKAFALRAATGEHLWTFDSGIRAQGPNRGLMYWTDGAGDRRIYAAVDALRLRARRAHRQADPDIRRATAASTCTAISDAIRNGSPSC